VGNTVNQLLTENICFRLCSEGAGTHNMLKCLINLGVTGFLPPPGGAQAAQIVMSCKQKKATSNEKLKMRGKA